MKNQIHKTALTLTVLLTLTFNISFSQFIVPAPSFGENTAGLTVSPYFNTGNDILDDGGNIYKVEVWSDASTNNNAGLSWNVYNGSIVTGNVLIGGGADIYHADVCIVKDANGDICAIVGYYNASAYQFFLEEYKWDGSSSFVYQTSTSVGGGYGTTLNVDGDDNGDFIMVFDDGAQIYSLTGQMNGGFNINNGGTPLFVTYGNYPDVCIFSDGSPSGQIVNLTYLGTFVLSGNLFIANASYSSFTGSSSPGLGLPLLPIAPTYGVLSNPRIACPNSLGNSNDWTVVWEDVDAMRNAFYIQGINDNGGTISSVMTYNDGSIIVNGSPIDLTAVPNFLPVVAYDDQATPNIWIGWVFDNSTGYYNVGSSGYTGVGDYAMYPIAVKCDNFAYPISTTDYWQVPNYVSQYDLVYPLSLAGRHANDELYLTYFGTNATPYVYSKEVTPSSSAGSLRSINNTQLNDAIVSNNIFNNSAEGLLTVKLFDLSRKVIIEERGLINELRNKYEKFSKNIPNSIYVIKLISDDGKYNLTQKIFITN